MRFISIAAAALAAVIGSAGASAQTWTGFYAGLSVGTADSDDIWKNITDPGTPDYLVAGHGGVFGFQGGYNWQYRNVVLGIEGDYMFSGLKGQIVDPNGNNLEHKVNDLGSVRGRIGWLGTPEGMIYVTAGPAWGSAQWTVSDPVTGSQDNGGSASHTATGIAFGAGLEALVWRNFSVKGEYLHYEFGNYTPTDAIYNGTNPTLHLYADTYKLGVNMHF